MLRKPFKIRLQPNLQGYPEQTQPLIRLPLHAMAAMMQSALLGKQLAFAPRPAQRTHQVPDRAYR